MKWLNRRSFLKFGGLAVLGGAAYAVNLVWQSQADSGDELKQKNHNDSRENADIDGIDNHLHEPPRDQSNDVVSVPRRKLGKTGEMVSLLGLGGAGIIAQEGEAARTETERIVKIALEQGVNYIDTAPTYGNSESNLGFAFNSLDIDRSQLFVATKTLSRSYRETIDLFERSLNRLQTDYIDLYQIHGVNNREDLADIMRDDGPLRAVEELKQSGKIKYTGITGHNEPEVLISALDAYDFDCLLMPLNAGDIHFKPFQTELLSKAQNKEMGVIAMKVMAYGNIFADDGINSPDQALAYTCSFPINTAIIGVSDTQEFRENLSIVKNFTPLQDNKLRELEKMTEHYYSSINHFRNW